VSCPGHSDILVFKTLFYQQISYSAVLQILRNEREKSVSKLRDYVDRVNRAISLSGKDGYRGQLWERQKARLAQYCELIQSHEGRLSVVTFPFLHALRKDYKYEFAHSELDRFWHDLKVPHLDLLPVFRELPPQRVTLNSLDPHPNEYAHAVAAEAIDRFVTEQMKTGHN